MRVIGMNIHRTFAEVVFNDKRVERIWQREGQKLQGSSPSVGGCGSMADRVSNRTQLRPPVSRARTTLLTEPRPAARSRK